MDDLVAVEYALEARCRVLFGCQGGSLTLYRPLGVLQSSGGTEIGSLERRCSNLIDSVSFLDLIFERTQLSA